MNFNELMEANALLRMVIDENPNIILMKDWNGKFLLGNRALSKLYGTTPEGLVGKDDAAFNPNAEQVAFYLQNVREVMLQGEIQVVLEESTDATTGETLYYQSIKIPLTTPDGNKQILVIANDVSELKRTQQKLEESERRLRYVLDATGEGIWDWNIVTGVVTHNRRWCQIVGLEDDYLEHPLGAFADLLHAHDKDKVMDRLHNCLSGQGRYHSEHRMSLKSDHEVWVRDRGDVVERDASGNATRMVGSFVDISQRKVAELAAAQRELYLRATLDNLPFLFWLKDRESRFLAVNKVFSSACGRTSPADIVGLNDLDIWPRELADSYRADDMAVMASRAEKFLEEPIVNGAIKGWIETYKKPVIDANGTLLGTVGFARDISQRKLMEKALQASEQRWELAISGANDGIWDWNPQTGEVYFSKRWKSMLGYEENEIGSSIEEWTKRVHHEDFEATVAELQRHLRGETDYYQSEHRLRCKNGEYKWILDRGRAFIDAQGIALRMVGSHSDITERRTAQALEREHAEQLDAIFALSPDGFVTFDAERHVKYVSPAFTIMTGLIECAVVGEDESSFSQRLAQACLPEFRFSGMAELRASLAIGASDTAQARSRHIIELIHDRKRRVLEVSLRQSQSHSVSQILFLRDITHETEVERLKSEFLSTAAHELRTPMASIFGFAEVLLTQKLKAAERKEFLEIIYRQSDLMSSILNELLDLARIEARRGKDFVIERIQVQSLVADVVSSFKLPDKRKAPLIEVSAIPWFVMVDRKKAQQAILNVLSNAYKYSGLDGLVRISITPVPCSVLIRVIDQGIGMTVEQTQRVGERFYRADTSGKVSGTGLGMSIVSEIMALHHRSVVIDSLPGQGTTVTLAFPTEPAV